MWAEFWGAAFNDRQAVPVSIMRRVRHKPPCGIMLHHSLSRHHAQNRPMTPELTRATVKRTVPIMQAGSQVLDTPEAPRINSADTPKLRPGAIPFLSKLKARNLYLTQGLTYADIAKETGIKQSTLEQMAYREGWTAIRRRTTQKLVEQQDARTRAMQDEVVEAIASTSEQHALRALEKTGQALERDDRDAARDSQSYSAAAKNLVGIVKALRDPGSASEGSSPTLNFFFIPAPAANPEPKQAEAIEVKSVKAG